MAEPTIRLDHLRCEVMTPHGDLFRLDALTREQLGDWLWRIAERLGVSTRNDAQTLGIDPSSPGSSVRLVIRGAWTVGPD